jgi:hypothetical protein
MVNSEIQQGKMIIEVDVAFLKRDVGIILPNMESMLNTFLKKEGCNGYALYSRPRITWEGKKNDN